MYFCFYFSNDMNLFWLKMVCDHLNDINLVYYTFLCRMHRMMDAMNTTVLVHVCAFIVAFNNAVYFHRILPQTVTLTLAMNCAPTGFLFSIFSLFIAL